MQLGMLIFFKILEETSYRVCYTIESLHDYIITLSAILCYNLI